MPQGLPDPCLQNLRGGLARCRCSQPWGLIPQCTTGPSGRRVANMHCVSGRFPFCIIPVGKARKPSVRGFLAAPLGLLPYSELQLYVPCRLLHWGDSARCRCLQPLRLSRRTTSVDGCLLVVGGWLPVGCWSFVGCRLWVVACWSLFVACCLGFVLPWGGLARCRCLQPWSLIHRTGSSGRLGQVKLFSALGPHTAVHYRTFRQACS